MYSSYMIKYLWNVCYIFYYMICRKGVVTYNHIMELREKLDKMLMTKGLIAEEKGTHTNFNVLDVDVSCINS